MTNLQTIEVDLGEKSYPIMVGDGYLSNRYKLSSYIDGHDCMIVTNETIAPIYLKLFLDNIEDKVINTVILPDGEEYKTIQSVQIVLDKLVECGANRDTTIIALGGGVIGDIAGFSAACYMRGLSFIQVPTTLLSQVDASVGGKTGVNHEGGKNLIGAFHQPKMVLIDIAFLDTLSDRHFRGGFSEVIKHGAIADAKYFSWLEENIDNLLKKNAEKLIEAITRSCKIKASIISRDEYDTGVRSLLNFGHTFGHAIEKCLGYGQWLHGEAIAAGMLMAARLSALSNEDLARLKNLLTSVGLPTTQTEIQAEKLFEAMKLDKKIQAKKLRFILLKSIGESYIDEDVSDISVMEVLNYSDT